MLEQEILRSKLSRTVFDKKWKSVIRKELNEWSRGGVPVRTSAREDIWLAFYAFGEHCIENYLDTSYETLDRYQLAACYLCAILAARPMVVEKLQMDDVRYDANEYAAIHVACSILAGYTMEAIETSVLSERDKAKASTRVREGLLFDSAFPTSAEPYLLSTLKALQFTAVERRYNVLLTALLMYHWEMALVGDGDLFATIATGELRVPLGTAVSAVAASQAPTAEAHVAQEPTGAAAHAEIGISEAAGTGSQAQEASFAGPQAPEPHSAAASQVETPVVEAVSAEFETGGAETLSEEDGSVSAGTQAEESQLGAGIVGGDTGEKNPDALMHVRVTPPVPARELVASGRLSQRERLRERKA